MTTHISDEIFMGDKKVDIPVHINLNKVQLIIRAAINEAGIYAGFAYNVKTDSGFTKYALVEDSNIQFVPITTDVNIIQKYKECFYDWVIENSFKYVVDRFSIFLDQIYCVCSLYNIHKTEYSMELINSMEKKERDFHKKKFTEKLTILESEFDVFPNKNTALLSIQSTRNCLTHRNGIVGKADLRNNSEFIVKWTGYHLYAKEQSGVEHDLNIIPPEGVLLPEGASIMLKPNADKQKTFHFNDKIHFFSREFAEILMYLQAEADHILKNAEKFAEKKGVPKI